MILIADCGSTKTEWCALEGNEVITRISTGGINALMTPEEELIRFFDTELRPYINNMEIDTVYFYGAGCTGGEVNGRVARALASCITGPTVIEVHSDLLAAARALCGHNPGIACILGTGSNSCLYDGQEIVEHVSPLGYILGDEGSGAVLGRLLIGDILKGQLPAELCDRFFATYDLDRDEILDRVYNRPRASAFLASVAPFLAENIEEPAIHRLVLNEFKAFFVRNISHYTGYKDHPIHITGSIGRYFRDVIAEAAAAMDCHLGTVTASPMEGLISYHSHE